MVNLTRKVGGFAECRPPHIPGSTYRYGFDVRDADVSVNLASDQLATTIAKL